MNGFTFCAHDIVRLVVTMGALVTVMAAWSGVLVLVARRA